MNRQDAKVAKEKKGSESIEKWYDFSTGAYFNSLGSFMMVAQRLLTWPGMDRYRFNGSEQW